MKKTVIFTVLTLFSFSAFADYKLQNCGKYSVPLFATHSGKSDCKSVNGEFSSRRIKKNDPNAELGFELVEVYLYYRNGRVSCWTFENNEHYRCLGDSSEYQDDFISGDINGPI